MQRIRKISNLFKKPDEAPTPDNFLDVKVSRQDRAHDRTLRHFKSSQLKHVKSVPLRTNKPSYRGGQHVPKDKIVYPLIPTTHHVDILQVQSRPSTSSYDTFNSEPTLDLLPPQTEKEIRYAKDVLRNLRLEKLASRDKPLPPSPPGTGGAQQSRYATTHGYNRATPQEPPAKVAATVNLKAAPASATAPRARGREVAKPVPGVQLSSKNAHLYDAVTATTPERKVDYTRLGPPTAQFSMFKPIDKGPSQPQHSAPSPAPASTRSEATSPALSAKPASRPRVFDGHLSDDSDSAYSIQISMDSISVLTDESPRNLHYARRPKVHRGDEHKRRPSVDEHGVMQEPAPTPASAPARRADDGDRAFVSSNSLRRYPAMRRTGSSGSLVNQSQPVSSRPSQAAPGAGNGGKNTYAQDMLSRAHKAAAVASLRAIPTPVSPVSAGSKNTKVHMAPSPQTAARGDYPHDAHFMAGPLEAGIPFPTTVLRHTPISPQVQSVARAIADRECGLPRAREHQDRYYDNIYASSSRPGSVMHSTPPPQARSQSPKLRSVAHPVPQVTIRPLNPHKKSTPQPTSSHANAASSSRSASRTLQPAPAKHAVKVSAASGMGQRRSYKAEVVRGVPAYEGGLSSEEELDLALSEPEGVAFPVLVPAPRKRSDGTRKGYVEKERRERERRY
ncbi:hypothetical protein EUX98_g3241 [Antrodiella citrinella]|uniref:Uncharacterized protein n=1 Tax=Antrodiella citrinella TaxID=2447956 RepID=A0A4S4MX08_9APHY|nr:hypothetical protein EUX98_g3241 [Antrodiella citrinella]